MSICCNLDSSAFFSLYGSGGSFVSSSFCSSSGTGGLDSSDCVSVSCTGKANGSMISPVCCACCSCSSSWISSGLTPVGVALACRKSFLIFPYSEVLEISPAGIFFPDL